jgi:hypothetical protein
LPKLLFRINGEAEREEKKHTKRIMVANGKLLIQVMHVSVG